MKLRGNGGNGSGRIEALDFLEYPCRFEIKAMGKHNVRFNALVQGIVSRHVDPENLLLSQTRLSRHGKYASVTCIIRATSKRQIHAIYADLADCPEVLMTL